MPIPRPKILSPVTFASSQDFEFRVSVAGDRDTTLTATVAAGTYYVAFDGQSDDLVRALQEAMATETDSAGLGFDGRPNVYINDDNKVVIHFCGDYYVDGAFGWENNVRIRPVASDADLMKALGFNPGDDHSSSSTDYPSFVADHEHGYGWYANADGQLASLLVEDRNLTTTPQAVSISGRVTSQNIGQRFKNNLELEWLDRGQTFSRGVVYGDTPLHPYDWNVPLECWWESARKGTEFRVYREGRNGVGVFIETGTSSAGSTSQVTDSSKSWSTTPQEYAGLACYTTFRSNSYQRMYISSNTSDDLVAPSTRSDGAGWCSTNDRFWVVDHRYQTYVVDLEAMKEFNPGEHEMEDYYRISIPLLRYES